MAINFRTPSRRVRYAVGAALALVLPLAGCGSSSSGSGQAVDDSSLEVWTRSTPEQAATYQELFDAFTAKTGIKVKYSAVQEFDTQLQARAAQKSLPDLLINDAGSLGSYEAQGFLGVVDRTAVEGQQSVSDASWAQTQGTDGKYYGIPFSRQANVLVIRKDWRTKLGLAVPKTWDDVSAMAKAFAAKDPDGNGKADTYGMSVPGTAKSGYIARWGMPYIWQAGGDLLKANGSGYTSVVNSPETAKGMEFIRSQFCTPGNVVPGSINFATADVRFQNGSSGMYVTGPYSFSAYDDSLGKDKVEVVPMPKGPQGDTTFAEGENLYFGSTSKKTADLQKLAAFLISAEGQELGMDSPASGKPGPYSSVVRLPVNTTVDPGKVYDDPRWKITAEAYASSSKTFPWNIDFNPFRQVLADGMNKIMSDCTTDQTTAVLADIDAGFKDELSKQGLDK